MIKINPKAVPVELLTYAKNLTKTHKNAEIYLVGGAVRDIILKRPTKDFDLVVKGVPTKKLEAWLKKTGRVNFVGKSFGVFKWQPKNWSYEPIDIALPRTEKTIKGTGQYKDFKIISQYNLDITEDLKRRDLTINALALNLISWQLIDTNHGLEDIKEKIINTVGAADQRFTEDLSRPLRAIRLACQLDFEFEPYTLTAIKKCAYKIANGKINTNWLVPRETIAREFLKALYSNPSRAVVLLDETGYLPKLLPEVAAMKGCPQPSEFHSEGDVWQHTKLALNAWQNKNWSKYFGNNKPSANVLLAVLLHDIGKPTTITFPENKNDRIHTNNHNNVGAGMANKIITRLKLTSYIDPSFGGINFKTINRLIIDHMLLVHGQPKNMKPSTLYKYFLKDKAYSQDLLQVIYMDISASIIGKTLKPNYSRFNELIKYLEKTKRQTVDSNFKPILSGNSIMKIFNLKPGPKIGQLLERLQTAQLNHKIKTKQQAIAYLRKYVR